jgi:hypothetical protein
VHLSGVDEYGVNRTAFQCACGWWQTHYWSWRQDSGVEWNHYGVRHAILRRFDPADSLLPVDALRKALVGNPDLIDDIARVKTEELVKSVFADYFDCEAKLVGQSHDGGIDVVLVLADNKTTLVQVKHRDKGSTHWKAEPVSTVREFLAAFMLEGGQHGIFVTTAHHFSQPAIAAARKALRLKDVLRYDLVDRDELLRILNLTTGRIRNHWRDNFVFTAT